MQLVSLTYIYLIPIALELLVFSLYTEITNTFNHRHRLQQMCNSASLEKRFSEIQLNVFLLCVPVWSFTISTEEMSQLTDPA